MALVSQTRTAGTITEITDGDIAWGDVASARVLDGNFATATVTSSPSTDNTHNLEWSDFGFSLDPLSVLSGFEITHSLIYGSTSIVHNTSTRMYSHGDVISTGVGLVASSSISGIRLDAVNGSPTTTWNVDVDGDYNGIEDINRSDFAITTELSHVTGIGSVAYRHFGLELTVYVNVPDDNISNTDATAARIGNAKIRTKSDNGVRYPVFHIGAGFDTKSSGPVVLGGQPISLYEDASGNRALAVYDTSGSLSGALALSESHFVYQGIRYGFLENDQYRVMRADTIAESSISINEYCVWQGVPLGLSPSGDIAAKAITGTVDEIRSFVLGGTPLTAVRVGSDWAIAISSI